MKMRHILPAIAVTAQLVVADINLLVFTKTAGFRHDSIPNGIELVKSIANERGWSVYATEDSAVFNAGNLSDFTTAVFISTTGKFLSGDESAALDQFLKDGGSWLGIHAAADFADDMPESYKTLVGAQFRSHPCQTQSICSAESRAKFPPSGNVRPDVLTIQDAEHPSTANIAQSHERSDEWYSYKSNVADSPDSYRVLVTLNETYIRDTIPAAEGPELQAMTPVHPISWCSLYAGSARAWYTGMGHTKESYSEDYFVSHVTGGLEWVTGFAA